MKFVHPLFPYFPYSLFFISENLVSLFISHILPSAIGPHVGSLPLLLLVREKMAV
jgi:hypothetical protein